MFGAYLLFVKYDISFNLGYAFGAIAFLGTAESSYTIIRDYLKDKINEKDNHKKAEIFLPEDSEAVFQIPKL